MCALSAIETTGWMRTIDAGDFGFTETKRRSSNSHKLTQDSRAMTWQHSTYPGFQKDRKMPSLRATKPPIHLRDVPLRLFPPPFPMKYRIYGWKENINAAGLI